MALGILGQKAGMTQWFDKDGNAIAATVIYAEPSVVVRIKKADADGYNAVQLGYGKVKEKNLNKPMKGHFERNGVAPKKVLREFRVENPDEFKIGQELNVSIFKEGEKINISGLSKGKGFQGVMKRWDFRGGDASHGSSGWHRRPGSIGSIRATGRTFKGWKMAGRMGHERITIKNLEVLKVYVDKNLLVVRGAVPGTKRSLLELKKRS